MDNEEKDQMKVADTGAEEAKEKPEAPLRGMANLRKRYQDANPDGDESGIDEWLDGYMNERDSKIADYDDFNNRYREAIDKDPRTGQFLYNLLDGMDIIDNLISIAGPELQDAVSSPEAKEKIDKLRAEAEELQAKRESNIESSQAVFDEFLADKDPEDVDKFDDYILDFFESMAEGKFTPEVVEWLWKGYKHDEDVMDAEDAGEIRGRNANIAAKLENQTGGDGVPRLSSLAGNAPKKPEDDKGRYAGTVWGRGGLK